MDSKTEEEFISIVTDITFIARSADWDSEISSLFVRLFSASSYIDICGLGNKICSCKPKMEFALVSRQSFKFRIFSLEMKLLSLVCQIISVGSSMDWDLQPKPELEVVSLIKQTISLFNSKPDSETELVSLITQTMRLSISADSNELVPLITQLASLMPEQELTSLITRIISRFRSMNWEPMQLISFCPQAMVVLKQEKFCVAEGVQRRNHKCYSSSIVYWRSTRQVYFVCCDCNGDNHGGYEKAPVEAKHSLHRQHSLQLVFTDQISSRECYCCEENLRPMFYYCEACDYAINFACAEKPPPVLSIDLPKRHHHPLTLFLSHDSLTCHPCGIKNSRCTFYICPPCGFVVHQKCLNLPHVIRISRHPHRISFIPCFEKGDWFCCVCRKKINNDYGGYSCIKEGCLYAVHSKCATQSNVWDGVELEGVLEETEEEELEPFIRIRDGIIQHFSHQDHHLRLVENTYIDYDEKKVCQACIMPIYFGNLYSCVTCDFILHEDCARLSRKVYHPIHPHMLTLVGAYDGGRNYACSACSVVCTNGFFYECREEQCGYFRLHVQCATISEPLVHGSHLHHLFLTSKPKERRACSVCEIDGYETFNCIEECDFSLCFRCATIPKRVRYKHDEHMLLLSYGDETSNVKYWCESCERNIDPKKWFYKCDDYCCVTLHIECFIGKDLYWRPGSSFVHNSRKSVVLTNNHHMSRPICSNCPRRCPFTIVFHWSGLIFCSTTCFVFFERSPISVDWLY